MVGTLNDALEREHREIDGGIEEFTAALASGDATASTESVVRALTALRRHIYLEEEFLFPPLRSAGLMGPVFVMLREHGEMWRTMDNLEPRLREPTGPRPDASVLEALQDLIDRLEAHNTKEETILYSQADELLSPEDTAQLEDFMKTEEMPPGWVCQTAAPTS